MAEWYSTVRIFQKVLINSLIDGHLGLFQFEAVIKEVITNIFHKSFCSYEHSFVLAVYPQVEFPGPMELILLETGSCPK